MGLSSPWARQWRTSNGSCRFCWLNNLARRGIWFAAHLACPTSGHGKMVKRCWLPCAESGMSEDDLDKQGALSWYASSTSLPFPSTGLSSDILREMHLAYMLCLIRGPVRDFVFIEIIDSPERWGVLLLCMPITLTVHHEIQGVIEHRISKEPSSYYFIAVDKDIIHSIQLWHTRPR